MSTQDAAHPAPGSLMGAEIAAQPQVLAGQLDRQLRAIRVVAERVRDADPRFVLLAARGTSDHAALYAKYLLETELGLPCGLASMSTLTAYGTTPRLADTLWVAVSQSGGSPDLAESTRVAAANGALTLAVTNAPDSKVAAAAHLQVDIDAGPELSVAATKTYTAQLQALWLLIDAWRGGDGRQARQVPAAIQQVLDESVALVATRYRFADRVLTVGRGFSYPTAREGALKLMETSYVAAQAFSGADLLHGPVAMVDVHHPVIVCAPNGVGAELLRPVLNRLGEVGAEVCLLGPSSLADDFGITTRLGDPVVDEQLSPLVQVVPFQALAREMALARGFDPDHPRGLRKVTETR
ncbi:SIS domain-containing protein [Pedococcus sp. 5OH_020]|uniref:SIS domain-containing protein n=1 Tax=Pedococcus sp. 5OH_020 TaxID=2989814 RepID=UPI0022E9F5E8|nr:SIS domain-containing protein [Pedococcus sp. 5OH_020]